MSFVNIIKIGNLSREEENRTQKTPNNFDFFPFNLCVANLFFANCKSITTTIIKISLRRISELKETELKTFDYISSRIYTKTTTIKWMQFISPLGKIEQEQQSEFHLF